MNTTEQNNTPSDSDLIYRYSRCLQEAYGALSDIAEGELESTDSATNLQWAEDRASETLSLIRDLMKMNTQNP